MPKFNNIVMWRGVLVLAGVVVVVAAIYIAALMPAAGLREPIENQLAAIRIEDNVTAYSLTSPAFQKATSMDQFVRFINEYSSLRNNESISFDERKITNGVGIVKATLISRGGVETPVMYQLIKEKNGWKIESIIITPQEDDNAPQTAEQQQPQLLQQQAAEKQPETKTIIATSSTPSNTTYQDPEHTYSLVYNSEWQVGNTESNKVIFNGKTGTLPGEASFSIQLVSTADNSLSVQEVADNDEAQIKDNYGSYNVVEDGLLPPGSNKNSNIHGKYAVYTYKINDKQMKQLQIIYFKSPKRAQYIIKFVAPEAQFDAILPQAKAMIASFTIL